MNKILLSAASLLMLNFVPITGNAECHCFIEAQKKMLLEKVGAKMPLLVSFPFYQYPNSGYEHAANHFQKEKILVFGYGSLMNKASASRSMKAEAVESMETAIAFGVKRIFNYKAAKTIHWGENQHQKEKAMLNLIQTVDITSMANGVTIEVDLEDFSRLVQRETGYDLVPILVVREKDVKENNIDPEVRVAYTFIAVNELRNHINYTSTKYYPVRGYLHAIQEAAALHGEEFARMWNETTYLADGTTNIAEWDENTFTGILCTFEPESE
jgi:cation transport regulator ChaC